MFNKTESEKIVKWESRHVINNVVVYALNAVILMLLFVLFIYINGETVRDRVLSGYGDHADRVC